MDTTKKNLICILILLTISTVISIRTNKLSNKKYSEHYQSGVDCAKAKEWSSDIANGKVAPWTYAGGQEVTYKGNLYRAMSGGQEVPGTHECKTDADCKHNGWQWMLVEQCRHDWNWNYHHHHHQSGVDCGKAKEWSSDIANGKVAPWTYAGGQEVTYKGNLYRAMWGGQEVPGTHECKTEADCKNKGWQWMLKGQCRHDWNWNFGGHHHNGGFNMNWNFGGHGGNNNYQLGVDCNGKNEWSREVANGTKAPWTYSGGQEVTKKGSLYKAMWGGQEEPGSHLCKTDSECKNNGWQWMLVGVCRRPNICNGKSEWSKEIANGTKAPWTYSGAQEVTYNGVLYRAMWGGQEVPGTHVCKTEGDCKNSGWQWMTVGQC